MFCNMLSVDPLLKASSLLYKHFNPKESGLYNVETEIQNGHICEADKDSALSVVFLNTCLHSTKTLGSFCFHNLPTLSDD